MKKRQWILLRGLAREQEHWAEFSKQLQESDMESEVIGVDLPGAGRYHLLSSPMTIGGIAEFVHSQLKTEMGSQRVVVAISLGGMVATELLRRYPEDYHGLALINSSFKNFSSVFQRLQVDAIFKLYQAMTARNLFEREMAVLNMVSHLPQVKKEEVAQKWSRIVENRPITPITFIKQLVAAAMYEAPLTAPSPSTLILTSIADDMVNFRCSKTIAEKWKVPIEIHETSGHEMTLDASDWVIEKLFKHFKI